MVVFDYDGGKLYQKCFSYSSPKPDDSKIDLRYYVLPNKQKVMLNSTIDIPSQYLIKANFEQMKRKESNAQVIRNINFNIECFNFVKKLSHDILEQYEVIYENI
jgi:hypothetical protein